MLRSIVVGFEQITLLFLLLFLLRWPHHGRGNDGGVGVSLVGVIAMVLVGDSLKWCLVHQHWQRWTGFYGCGDMFSGSIKVGSCTVLFHCSVCCLHHWYGWLWLVVAAWSTSFVSIVGGVLSLHCYCSSTKETTFHVTVKMLSFWVSKQRTQIKLHR